MLMITTTQAWKMDKQNQSAFSRRILQFAFIAYFYIRVFNSQLWKPLLSEASEIQTMIYGHSWKIIPVTRGDSFIVCLGITVE